MISTFIFIVGANLSAGPLHNLVVPPRLADVVQADLHLVQTRTLEDVVFQLQAAGYVIEDINRTFLGRLRIIALYGDTRREIVMSRSTGEIFSDTVAVVRPTPAPAPQAGAANTGAGNGQGNGPSENANPRSNERGAGSGGASNSNRNNSGNSANSNRGGGGNADNSNRGGGGGGNSNSNARSNRD